MQCAIASFSLVPFGGARRRRECAALHQRCAIDPELHVRDLLVPRLAAWNGEVVAHRRAAEGYAAQKGVMPEPQKVGIVGLFGKIIACDLRSVEALIGAVVDKLEHVEPPGVFGERFPKRIGRQAGEQTRPARAFDGFESRRCRGEQGAVPKIRKLRRFIG